MLCFTQSTLLWWETFNFCGLKPFLCGWKARIYFKKYVAGSMSWHPLLSILKMSFWNSFCVHLQMCTSKWRRDKEPVLLEGELSGAVEQHKPTTALDYCFPSAQLGVPARGGGSHTGRGRGTQTPTLKSSYTEDSPFLPPHPSCLASMLRLKTL